MFTMPASDPINPNVHPLIYRLNPSSARSQAAALEAAGKEGIMHNSTYTSFWEGAMAWSGWWHNEVGLLTEAASAQIATPMFQLRAEATRPRLSSAHAANRSGSGRSRRQAPDRALVPDRPPRDITPRADYPRPWLGGPGAFATSWIMS